MPSHLGWANSGDQHLHRAPCWPCRLLCRAPGGLCGSAPQAGSSDSRGRARALDLLVDLTVLGSQPGEPPSLRSRKDGADALSGGTVWGLQVGIAASLLASLSRVCGWRKMVQRGLGDRGRESHPLLSVGGWHTALSGVRAPCFWGGGPPAPGLLSLLPAHCALAHRAQPKQ